MPKLSRAEEEIGWVDQRNSLLVVGVDDFDVALRLFSKKTDCSRCGAGASNRIVDALGPRCRICSRWWDK